MMKKFMLTYLLFCYCTSPITASSENVTDFRCSAYGQNYYQVFQIKRFKCFLKVYISLAISFRNIVIPLRIIFPFHKSQERLQKKLFLL